MASFRITGTTKCNIYLLLWILYNLQGTLYTSGSVLSQLFLLIILTFSLIDFFTLLSRRDSPPVLKGLNVLIGVFTVYGILHIMFGEAILHNESEYPTYGFLKSIYSSLLPLYSFYLYTKEGYLSLSSLRKWIVVFFIIAIIQYFRNQKELIYQLELQGSFRDEVTNNSGYLFLSLIPAMIAYYHKPILQYLGLSICVLFAIMAMKRGVMLISVIVLIYFFITSIKAKKRAKGLEYVILIIAIIYGGWVFISNDMMQSDYFMLRLQSTLDLDSSGRDYIFSYFWDYFLNRSSYIEMLFGHGAWATARLGPNFAHNDWIELLFNQGILSVFLYIAYWIQYIKTIRDNRFDRESHQIIVMFFIITFLKSLFSAGYSDMSVYSNCLLGFALADGFKLARIRG